MTSTVFLGPTRRPALPSAWPPVLAMSLATLGACLLGLFVGAVELPASTVLSVLAEALGLPVSAFESDAWERTIVMDLRLPRLLMGLGVGAALGLSGALMQGLFRNPLADPTLIGVSSGAALGAALTIVAMRRLVELSGIYAELAVPVAAFVGGLVTTLFVYRLAIKQGRTAVATMLLAGIAINALAFSGTGLLIFIADDAELRDITFWTLGSLAGASWQRVLVLAIMVVAAGGAALRAWFDLDALAMGEVEAEHVGVETDAVRRRLVVCTAAMVGSAVAVAGQIAFVGLVVPHAVRLVLGPGHLRLLPTAAMAGGLVLVVADVVARTAVAPVELPIGIMTALLGAPFFLYLLRRGTP